jgi:acyl dehydratase
MRVRRCQRVLASSSDGAVCPPALYEVPFTRLVALPPAWGGQAVTSATRWSFRGLLQAGDRVHCAAEVTDRFVVGDLDNVTSQVTMSIEEAGTVCTATVTLTRKLAADAPAAPGVPRRERLRPAEATGEWTSLLTTVVPEEDGLALFPDGGWHNPHAGAGAARRYGFDRLLIDAPHLLLIATRAVAGRAGRPAGRAATSRSSFARPVLAGDTLDVQCVEEDQTSRPEWAVRLQRATSGSDRAGTAVRGRAVLSTPGGTP